MSSRTEQDLALAERVDEHGRNVTSWEAEFLDRILTQLDADQALTARQRSTLQRISRQRCGGDAA